MALFLVPRCSCGGGLVGTASTMQWATDILRQMGYARNEARSMAEAFEASRLGIWCESCDKPHVVSGPSLLAINCACESPMRVQDGGGSWMARKWQCDRCGLLRTTQELLVEKMARVTCADGSMLEQVATLRGM